ncbi:SDR family oxidoreductase [Mycobacterium sp. 1274761.0]|uniref:SDR family oxidoreductase n=1 Tax=Mycobacterium sp. 1274761.0 TaxID=1834077 RepID=UPI001E472760|nr:SDR family oxidoreductase [Mycobacterium sp. 1274761.0]
MLRARRKVFTRIGPSPTATTEAPGDIAGAVAYLPSPEAAFITGITWNVDGGFAA